MWKNVLAAALSGLGPVDLDVDGYGGGGPGMYTQDRRRNFLDDF